MRLCASLALHIASSAMQRASALSQTLHVSFSVATFPSGASKILNRLSVLVIYLNQLRSHTFQRLSYFSALGFKTLHLLKSELQLLLNPPLLIIDPLQPPLCFNLSFTRLSPGCSDAI